MKQSRFNLWVKDYPDPGYSLVYNARTQALFKIDPGLCRALTDLNSGKRTETDPALSRYVPALLSNGIIVETDELEQEKIDNFFQEMQSGASFLPFEVTLLTTYSCNFRCPYCFEGSVKECVFLNKETSSRIISWIRHKTLELGFKKLFLVFYGGEPLLHPGPIYDISSRLKKWAGEQGIEFKFGIITNGSLLTPELVDRLKPLGLEEVRTSLDGTREAHNKKRPFADGAPTFDLILENIKAVIDKIPVGLTGCFDRENLDSIIPLIDFLEKEGLLHKFSRIDFSPLAPRLGEKDRPGKIELGNCLSFFDNKGLSREILEIKKELLRRKVCKSVDLAVNACSLIMEKGGVAIDPYGDIYKCNALIGYKEFSVGNVREPAFNERFRDFLKIKAWEQCPQDCPYLLLCQGGCRLFSYLEQNCFDRKSCKKEYLDNIVPELIKLEYQRLAQKAEQE